MFKTTTLLSLLFACMPMTGFCQSSAPKASSEEALFDHFSYKGDDDFYKKNPLKNESQFYNPVLPGFYPDPAIVGNGKGDYYMAVSTFTFFPGVPVFHSKDLVNWKQVGHILSRESQMENMRGQHISGGIFAPALSYNPKTGTYYMITTNVGAGNFYVKTQDPAGEWSDPIHVPSIQGIDPSIFIDEDGKAYIVNNDDAPDAKPEYPGHRTVRIQELDLQTDKCVGERKIIVNKGCRPEEKPIWCEAPHIYKLRGMYYLMTAEGGTADWHSEVIYRSENVWGPYVPYEGNPILTQRTLNKDRENAVTCAGHADLIQTTDGQWWATFLGVRPVNGEETSKNPAGGWENLGRETFLIPVTWTEDGWPMMTGSDGLVPLVLEKKGAKREGTPTFGNFAWQDEFKDKTALSQEWVTLRTPARDLVSTATHPGWLTLKKSEETIEGKQVPAFVARRIQHHKFETSVAMRFAPKTAGDAAGIVLYKDETHHLMMVRTANGMELKEVKTDKSNNAVNNVLATAPCKSNDIELKIASDGNTFMFSYRPAGSKGAWKQLGTAPACGLSTKYAGGFTGTMIGLYCTSKCK